MTGSPSIPLALVQSELDFRVTLQTVPVPGSPGVFQTRVYLTPKAGSQLLHVGDVAEQLGVSPRTVRRLLASGAIPSRRPGLRRRRVMQRDLDAYLRGIGGIRNSVP